MTERESKYPLTEALLKTPEFMRDIRQIMTEQEIVDRYSTPGLKRNEVSRSTKKLTMKFDSRFNGMSRHEREEFLNEYFPEWPKRIE